MYNYNLENRVERGQSAFTIVNAYQININYWQSRVFKNKGDDPFIFLLAVFASDIKQDGCYAGNVNHKNIYSPTTAVSPYIWLK